LSDNYNARIDGLTTGLGKVQSRFVRDLIEGISRAKSLRLSKIGEALHEEIPLHATHKRLSRNLADNHIGQFLMSRILELEATKVTKDTRIVLDQFSIIKRFATKMEFIEEIKSEDTPGMGYRMCEVLISDTGSGAYRPLTFALWSRNAPEYTSDRDQIMALIRQVQDAGANQGTFILNASLGATLGGGDSDDSDDVLTSLATESTADFIIRLYGERNLTYRQHCEPVRDLAKHCNLLYSRSVFKYKADQEKQYCLQYGYIPVTLPEAPDRKLSLVVVRCDGYETVGRPAFYYLLTSMPMRRNQQVLWRIVEAYTTRWQVICSNRLVHEKFCLHDLRVLTYDRIKNLAALTLATHSSYSDDISGLPLTARGLTYKRRYQAPPAITKAKVQTVVRRSPDYGLSFPNIAQTLVKLS